MKTRALLLAATLSTALTSPAFAADRSPLDMECEVNPTCLEANLATDALAASLSLRAREHSHAAVVYAEIPPGERLRLQQVRQLGLVAALVNTKPATPTVTATEDPIAEVIAARDARMLHTLTTQSISAITLQGLENDGETTSAERQAAEAFYAARDHAPFFMQAGAPNERGIALLQLFAEAEAYGLNPVDFENTAFIASDETAGDAMAAARADIGMTLWAIRYARHATTGRVNPANIASDITLERNFIDPATVMPALTASDDLASTLLAYHPPHAEFHALREELARVRDRSDDEQVQPIAEGGTLRLGDSDPRVPQLRARLGVELVAPDPITTASISDASVPDTNAVADIKLVSSTADEAQDLASMPTTFDPNLFEETLDAAIKTFQAEHNLTADGIVGPATFAALNEQAGDLAPHIIANMERWRWMPRELGQFHVIANVPEYRLWVRRDGESFFTTRTVVGRNQHRTAIFSDEMEYMAVNPYWNVPSSIARNEILPRLLQDPGYANRGNYEVIYNGQSVDPFAINWQAAAEQGMPRIRQRPGSRNALGEIKFMFPNQHAIYFHDTPSRGLFSRDQRAFSHGCVRVLDPWSFAQALLTNEADWDLARARSLQGSRERNLILDEHIPVHITYFTARVNEEGRLIMARDIYGHHGRVLAALGFTSS
ncbi:MAG: murein L,D-transpeptidase [Devosiaceae bacterium]